MTRSDEQKSVAAHSMETVSDASLRKSIRKHILISSVIAIAITAGIGGWSAVAQISGAIVSSGTVVVETNTKQVQHREGGIVKDIRVQNGDIVQAGDLLLRLDDTVTRANLSVITKQLRELTAQEARLVAERDDLEEISFDDSVEKGNIELGQAQLMTARRESVAGRKNQLEEQIRQFDKQIEGLTAQLQAKTTEIDLVDEELADLSDLLTKNLVSKSRVTSLRRERARLQGEFGEFLSQIARSEQAISERRVQILQIGDSYRAEVLEQLQNVRSEIARLQEQRIAAEDELTRVDIRAPQTGYVHQLAVHTIGGVVAPGETVMVIVPQEDKLIIETQVRPVDIDQLATGQKASVRFPSFDQRTTPELDAELLTVSADLIVDERSGASFYTARLIIPEDELEKLDGKVLVPGMPVEAFMKTGERTVLSYLVKPVVDQIAHAMRER